MKEKILKHKAALIAFLVAASPLLAHFGIDLNADTVGEIIDKLLEEFEGAYLAVCVAFAAVVGFVERMDPRK